MDDERKPNHVTSLYLIDGREVRLSLPPVLSWEDVDMIIEWINLMRYGIVNSTSDANKQEAQNGTDDAGSLR